MAERHRVRRAERDDVRVGGEQVVGEGRLPLRLLVLLWEEEVSVGGLAADPGPRAAAIEVPADKTEAQHVDDQHAEPCQQQLLAILVAVVQQRKQNNRALHTLAKTRNANGRQSMVLRARRGVPAARRISRPAGAASTSTAGISQNGPRETDSGRSNWIPRSPALRDRTHSEKSSEHWRGPTAPLWVVRLSHVLPVRPTYSDPGRRGGA